MPRRVWYNATDRHGVISKLFSESAQGMFNIPELIQMEEAAKQQCQRVLHRSIMHFAEKLFLKAFPLTVSSKRNNCSFQNLLCSNTNEQLRPSYGVMKGFFMLFFLPWIIPSPQIQREIKSQVWAFHRRSPGRQVLN